MNIDVLAKALREVDNKNYDHPLMCKVLHHLSCLEPRLQQLVIKVALGIDDFTYEDLVEHIRGQFVILQQVDNLGAYCGLGFGEKCVSVATWDSWGFPEHAQDTDITKVCYSDGKGELRCGHLLDFVEMSNSIAVTLASLNIPSRYTLVLIKLTDDFLLNC